jgi:hypothetical protein
VRPGQSGKIARTLYKSRTSGGKVRRRPPPSNTNATFTAKEEDGGRLLQRYDNAAHDRRKIRVPKTSTPLSAPDGGYTPSRRLIAGLLLPRR